MAYVADSGDSMDGHEQESESEVWTAVGQPRSEAGDMCQGEEACMLEVLIQSNTHHLREIPKQN